MSRPSLVQSTSYGVLLASAEQSTVPPATQLCGLEIRGKSSGGSSSPTRAAKAWHCPSAEGCSLANSGEENVIPDVFQKVCFLLVQT